MYKRQVENVVEIIGAPAAPVQHLAGMVVDLDCMRAGDRGGIARGQPVPFGMGNRDEGAGIEAALRELGPGLAVAVRGEVEGQADGCLLYTSRCV